MPSKISEEATHKQMIDPRSVRSMNCRAIGVRREKETSISTGLLSFKGVPHLWGLNLFYGSSYFKSKVATVNVVLPMVALTV